MKKSIFLFIVLSIVSFSLMSLQKAVASVVVHNDTGEKIFIQKTNGAVTMLFPSQSVSCSYDLVHRFNVLIANPAHRKLTTVCTISPAVDGETVRITKILSHQLNGGCYSYYRFIQ